MNLLSLTLSLSLTFAGGEPTGDFSFNVTPVVAVQAPVNEILGPRADATAFPGVIFYDPNETSINDQKLMTHELNHIEQQTALGGAFWVSYWITAGRPFEDYDPVRRFSAVPELEDSIESVMWLPPDHMKNKFPVFRVQRRSDETKFQFLPGYPGINFEVER